MGTARAAAATTAMLERHEVDRVVMIGIAGGIGPSVAVGDLVVPEVVIDGATGAELVPEPPAGFVPRGGLHTSDEFIQDPAAVAALVDRGVIALDMETAAVGAICAARGLPWSVLRGISDHHIGLPVDPAVLELTDPEGRAKPAAVARFVATRPWKVPHLARLAKGASAAIAASTAALVETLPPAS
jgi:adenosylhomocysteine nucleosidase